MATAVFGLIFSQTWRALAGFLVYVTLFQVLLFPGFTARLTPILFPVIVLFAGLGVFASVKKFSAALRASPALQAPLKSELIHIAEIRRRR